MSGASVDALRERLKEAIGTSTSFAQRSRFNERTLRRWLKGPSSPSAEELGEIAALTGRKVGWFYGEEIGREPRGEPSPPAGVVRIGVVDALASAGDGAWNDHAIEIDGVPFPYDWLTRLAGPGVNARKCDFIRAKGESMWPTIADGALVLINRNDQSVPLASAKRRTPNDDIFVFAWKGDLKVKRLLRQPGEQMTIISDNMQLFPPEIVPAHAALTVFGRVIWWDNRL